VAKRRDGRSGVRIPAVTTYVSLFISVDTGSGAHPASCTMDTGIHSGGGGGGGLTDLIQKSLTARESNPDTAAIGVSTVLMQLPLIRMCFLGVLIV
jgi:hypothetical protein